MSDLFPPGMPVMFPAVRGGGIPVQQIGVVVAYPRKPHPTSWVLVRVPSGSTVEVKVDNLSAVEFLTLLPKSSCENDDHAFAGACTRECADLVDAMSGDGYTEPQVYSDYLGGESSYDVSGCHGGPQRSYDVVHYDAANKAVVCLTLHDPGCECGSERCPERLAEARWAASPEGVAWQAKSDAQKHEANMAAFRAARTINV